MALDSYQIVQNEALGAHVIWEYSRFYNQYSIEHDYSPLLLALPVLPLVYNVRVREDVYNRNFKEGSLLRTISETHDIYSGLQERMESMADLSLKSLHNAIQSNLIYFDKDSTKLIPIRKTSLMGRLKIEPNSDYDKIIHSSKRIGAWFGQLSTNEILTYFNLKF